MKWLSMIFVMESLCFAQFDFLNPIGSGDVDVTRVVKGASKVVKGATGIGLREELAIGGAVAVEIVARYGGIWRDISATQRINLIGKTVANFGDRPDLNYRFGILNSDEVNAFSAPGGYVFITRGAYQKAASDSELAGVLAHEVAHIGRRHALKIISRSELISGLTETASGASGDFAAYDLGVDKISNTLLKFGYDSDSEFEADRVGKRTASVAGYENAGLCSFLKGLESQGEKKTFSTHPDLQERIERLSGRESERSSHSSSESAKLKIRGGR